ncbi:hypothetical protein M1590_04685 [Candidatus Marsarchaeota archaeon]|nr:hypothetical protein [Candidatus Marsarchaeota archaeon]
MIGMVWDTFKDGIDAVLHPEHIRVTKMSVGDSLAMYYKFSVIPLVLLAIVALGAGFLLQGVLAATGLLNGVIGGSVALLAVAGVVVYVWGIVPIGLLVFSVIVHWIGKGLDTFKGDYGATFNAAVYGMFGPLAVLWLSVLPVIGGLIQLIAFVWSIYVLVVVLGLEHKTTRIHTLVVLVAAGVVIWLVTQLVAGWVTLGFLGLVVGPLVGAIAGTLATVGHITLPAVGGGAV